MLVPPLLSLLFCIPSHSPRRSSTLVDHSPTVGASCLQAKMACSADAAHSYSCAPPTSAAVGWTLTAAVRDWESPKQCHSVSSVELACLVEAPSRLVSRSE